MNAIYPSIDFAVTPRGALDDTKITHWSSEGCYSKWRKEYLQKNGNQAL